MEHENKNELKPRKLISELRELLVGVRMGRRSLEGVEEPFASELDEVYVAELLDVLDVSHPIISELFQISETLDRHPSHLLDTLLHKGIKAVYSDAAKLAETDSEFAASSLQFSHQDLSERSFIFREVASRSQTVISKTHIIDAYERAESSQRGTMVATLMGDFEPRHVFPSLASD